jgi:hypothetical protein
MPTPTALIGRSTSIVAETDEVRSGDGFTAGRAPATPSPKRHPSARSGFVRPRGSLWRSSGSPAIAGAHPRSGAADRLPVRFLSPDLRWDHILAMISVGLWGAQLGAPAMWLLPVTFPMVMARAAMGLLGIPCPVSSWASRFLGPSC